MLVLTQFSVGGLDALGGLFVYGVRYLLSRLPRKLYTTTHPQVMVRAFRALEATMCNIFAVCLSRIRFAGYRGASELPVYSLF